MAHLASLASAGGYLGATSGAAHGVIAAGVSAAAVGPNAVGGAAALGGTSAFQAPQQQAQPPSRRPAAGNTAAINIRQHGPMPIPRRGAGSWASLAGTGGASASSLGDGRHALDLAASASDVSVTVEAPLGSSAPGDFAPADGVDSHPFLSGRPGTSAPEF